jgi:hypothetical protein
VNYADILDGISRRVRFFTKENADQIPDSPGIYAWFLPLWRLEDDCAAFIRSVQGLYFYDASGADHRAVATTEASFHWERAEISIERGPNTSVTAELKSAWDAALGDANQKKVVEAAIMEASIFMPPLYVGKADNLQVRYQGHVQAGAAGNSFNTRFTAYAKSQNLRLRITDLLFGCIEARPQDRALWRDEQLNWLIEQLLIRVCRPPFSIR